MVVLERNGGYVSMRYPAEFRIEWTYSILYVYTSVILDNIEQMGWGWASIRPLST
jgi:hypothetical protein